MRIQFGMSISGAPGVVVMIYFFNWVIYMNVYFIYSYKTGYILFYI